MLIVYMAVLITGMYWVSKNLLPELLTSSSLRTLPPKTLSPQTYPETDSYDSFQFNEPPNRIEKLEIFLNEKNRNIDLLQKELRILYVQVRDYDKVKTLLEDEIHRLKEQNRIFRSELGMPTVQPKENLFI